MGRSTEETTPEPGAETIRLLVADDEKAVVDVLEALIRSEADLRFVGSARDAEGAIALAVKERPDVALLDVRMPGGGGLRAAREITRRCPQTRVIALTAHEDEATIISMMGAGAHAYVPKGESTARILREIHRGAERAPLSDAVAGVLSGEGKRTLDPAERRQTQRARIREVLDDKALSAAFQPIFDVETGTIVGAEALARIARLPVRGADSWFAEAAAVGLGSELELAAVAAALEAMTEVPPHAFVAINVSPQTVAEPAFEELMGSAPGERIVIEITEQAAVEDYAALNAVLNRLRGAGVRIAVDDVGAGIASLHHVVMLAPEFLKIDRSLTEGVESDPARHAVVAALTSCASHLGATVVAEGVAATDQLKELIRLGVDLVQGFLLAEPGSLAEITWKEAFRSHPFRADTSRRFGSA